MKVPLPCLTREPPIVPNPKQQRPPIRPDSFDRSSFKDVKRRFLGSRPKSSSGSRRRRGRNLPRIPPLPLATRPGKCSLRHLTGFREGRSSRAWADPREITGDTHKPIVLHVLKNTQCRCQRWAPTDQHLGRYPALVTMNLFRASYRTALTINPIPAHRLDLRLGTDPTTPPTRLHPAPSLRDSKGWRHSGICRPT